MRVRNPGRSPWPVALVPEAMRRAHGSRRPWDPALAAGAARAAAGAAPAADRILACPGARAPDRPLAEAIDPPPVGCPRSGPGSWPGASPRARRKACLASPCAVFWPLPAGSVKAWAGRDTLVRPLLRLPPASACR